MLRNFRKSDINQIVNSVRKYIIDVKSEPKNKASDGLKYSVRGEVPYNAEKVQSDVRQYRDGNLSASELIDRIDKTANKSFVEKMLEYINQKQVRDSKIYKAANIDRRLFSKIVSDYSYKPAKDTCIALALALNLTLEQAIDLLERAGYTISHSNHRDIIIEYFFKECFYNLNDINEVLFRLNQKPIGRF